MNKTVEPIPIGKSHFRLLLIEDDSEDAHVIKRILSRYTDTRIMVEWAQDFEEAERLSRSLSFDVVLLDYYLGAETAKEVLDRFPISLKRTAKIVLTGRDPVLVDREAFSLGADFFLPKEGLNYTVLHRAIRYVARNKDLENRLSDFSRTVAHDLRGPISNISDATKFLRSDLGDRLEMEQEEWMEIVVKECARISELISDLQDYSMSLDGSLLQVETDITSVVSKAKELLRADLDKKEATVEIGEIPKVSADPKLLIHVFQNLIQNGIKYNRSPKPKIEITGSATNGHCVIRVADNGIGIEPESRDRIFQAMERLPNVHGYSGTGLGLHVCKVVVERHGGEIWVESPGIEETGSTFCVRLPLWIVEN